MPRTSTLAVPALLALVAIAVDASPASAYPWDSILPSADRFELRMNDEAVLDNETGLVWERAPYTATNSWDKARDFCHNKPIGGRYGWRLPTVHELATLRVHITGRITILVPAIASGLFQNIAMDDYWTSTQALYVPNVGSREAWTVSFDPADRTTVIKRSGTLMHRWICVRGPSSTDAI